MRRAVGLVSAVSSAALLAWVAGSVNAGSAPAGTTQVPLFPDTMTAREWQQVANSAWFNGTDFASVATVWTGDGLQGASGAAAAASLTYSFPADGTSWTLGGTTAANALNASLTSTFGASNLDQGREFIRQSMAAWKRVAGVTFTEVADNNSAFDTATPRTTSRGDIRVGGIPVGTGANPVAASNPPASGGDIALNTSFFIPANLANSANSYRYLRNAMGHELGTALGLLNVVPCNGTKLMEGQVNVGFDGPQVDDIRGIQGNYGDRFSGNMDALTARNYGNLFNPVNRSVRERDLSTNGTTGPGNTDEDWHRFQTTVNFQNIVITATPTGGTYLNGAQSGGACNGATASVNASQAGVLTVELRNQAGDTVIQAQTGVAGAATVLTRNSVPPGIYTVRVVDAGPNPAANQRVQTYDLTIQLSAYNATPYANAGVHKRVEAGTTAYFMGDINSFATQPGATITSYDWDLDGNGSFEVTNNPRPTTSYTADGVYPVSLRVTDSNGRSSTDTINVTVFNAITGINWRAISNGVSPRTGTAPGTDPVAGAAWTSGGPWKTYDLVVEGRPTAQLNAVNLGADGAPYSLAVSGTVFNHPLGSNVRSFAVEPTFAAVFFDTYACYGGTTTTDGGATNFAGTTNLSGAGGVIQATTFTQPAGSLVADNAAPAGGSIRVLRVTVNGTVGGGSSSVELGLPNGLTRVYSIPLAVATVQCPGDTNGDGVVDFIDLNNVLSSFGIAQGQPGYIPGADVNNDMVVDFLDLNIVLSFFGVSCAVGDAPAQQGEAVLLAEYTFGVGDAEACRGDVNRDGRVTFADLNAILGSMGLTSSSGAIPADLNADGLVDSADLHEAVSAYGSGF